MRIDVLPSRPGAAAENMAADFFLLQQYPKSEYPRFRDYGWHRSAFTFGYSQKIAFVRGQLPSNNPVELCRRPTGGGLVDHRSDWTYALVIPRGHPAEELRALASYRLIHAALAEALTAMGQPASLEERLPPTDPSGGGICFDRAELFDVIDPASGKKIAGAAQKRNKHGLLLQGSIERKTVNPMLDWDGFRSRFIDCIAHALSVEPRETPWPDWSEEALSALTEHYSTPEWNEFR